MPPRPPTRWAPGCPGAGFPCWPAGCAPGRAGARPPGPAPMSRCFVFWSIGSIIESPLEVQRPEPREGRVFLLHHLPHGRELHRGRRWWRWLLLLVLLVQLLQILEELD